MTSGPGCRLTSTERGDGSVLVALAGELDAETSGAVREQLFELIEPGRTVVLDLGGLDFLDSTGLGLLVLALTRIRAADGHLAVVNPTSRVHRLIETSRLVELFGLGGPSDETRSVAGDEALRPVRDPSALEELRALLVGFENLLRWGDLRPEQVTLALGGTDLADETTDLALAARVRRVLGLLGAASPWPADDS